MWPSALRPVRAMWSASCAAAIRSPGIGLKAQRRVPSGGSITTPDPARLMVGTPAAAITSRMASEAGVAEAPRIASTCSSSIILRAARVAAVVSVASSSTTQRTAWPAMAFGSRSMVLRSGMPSPAPGPVRDSSAPRVTSARAGAAPAASKAISKGAKVRRICNGFLGPAKADILAAICRQTRVAWVGAPAQ